MIERFMTGRVRTGFVFSPPFEGGAGGVKALTPPTPPSKGGEKRSPLTRAFRQTCSILCALFFFLASSSVGWAKETREVKRDNVTLRAEIDADRALLSGHISLWVVVEGPAPVVVTLPEAPAEALTPESRQKWKVEKVVTPLVEEIGAGRQRWRQKFRLEPYQAGPKVPIELVPVKVRAGSLPEMTIAWRADSAFQVEVVTEVSADPKSLRPITGVEGAPPPTPATARAEWPFALAVVAGAILTMLGVYLLVRRSRVSQPEQVHDAVWALREIESLERQRLDGPRTFGRLADVLRLFIQEWREAPATRMTTAEIITHLLEHKQIAADDAQELQSILERCDLGKFANIADSAASADAAAWIERAWRFLAQRVETESAQSGAHQPTSGNM
jgi:hypothetical protein